MKAVLISIKPQWCEKIANGKKTVEVRKTRPKLETPFKVYIYCTNAKPFLVWGDVFRGNWETEITTVHGYSRKDADAKWGIFNGRVLGEFICNNVECFTTDYRMNEEQTKRISGLSCLDMVSLMEYEANAHCLYGWHISELKIYDEPKLLFDFYKCGALSPEELDDSLCGYCSQTDYGDKKEIHTPNYTWMCEGRWCVDAYQEYLDDEFALTRPPQSWCYVQEV